MKRLVYLVAVIPAALSLSACAGMQMLSPDMVFVKGHGFMHMKDADDMEDTLNADIPPGQKWHTVYDHFPLQNADGRAL